MGHVYTTSPAGAGAVVTGGGVDPKSGGGGEKGASGAAGFDGSDGDAARGSVPSTHPIISSATTVRGAASRG